MSNQQPQKKWIDKVTAQNIVSVIILGSATAASLYELIITGNKELLLLLTGAALGYLYPKPKE